MTLGKIKHSQKMNEPSLQAWVLCNQDGSVETGHCTCMAGAGEVCSHVVAILYALQYIAESKDTVSCTDVRSLWNVPKTAKVKCKPIRGIDFGQIFSGSRIPSKVPCMSDDHIVQFLTDIEEAGSSSVLSRVTEPFAERMAE
ncbi:uncharacterized protein [Diabrotica undecimpunctata]|uniref:uncharacterized protein n=1 Tax=Diabrotica undecimpunctata TaxID=50387 RepID=UPI003B63BE88